MGRGGFEKTIGCKMKNLKFKMQNERAKGFIVYGLWLGAFRHGRSTGFLETGFGQAGDDSVEAGVMSDRIRKLGMVPDAGGWQQYHTGRYPSICSQPSNTATHSFCKSKPKI
jgi:hypothetical protein